MQIDLFEVGSRRLENEVRDGRCGIWEVQGAFRIEPSVVTKACSMLKHASRPWCGFACEHSKSGLSKWERACLARRVGPTHPLLGGPRLANRDGELPIQRFERRAWQHGFAFEVSLDDVLDEANMICGERLGERDDVPDQARPALALGGRGGLMLRDDPGVLVREQERWRHVGVEQPVPFVPASGVFDHGLDQREPAGITSPVADRMSTAIEHLRVCLQELANRTAHRGGYFRFVETMDAPLHDLDGEPAHLERRGLASAPDRGTLRQPVERRG
ncbi:MAG: hypothetical protein KC731_25685 [Myxococcales bacterium]|nr:hypothetical protein [Myxococcales bacterium]